MGAYGEGRAKAIRHFTVDYLRDRRVAAFILPPSRPYRLAVRTPPFHGGSTGSIPVRVATYPLKLDRRYPGASRMQLIPMRFQDEAHPHAARTPGKAFRIMLIATSI